MAFRNYREESRLNWGREYGNTDITRREDIQLGCLLRIADATEAMSRNYVQLQSELESARTGRDYWRAERDRQERRVRALRGLLKKKSARVAR